MQCMGDGVQYRQCNPKLGLNDNGRFIFDDVQPYSGLGYGRLTRIFIKLSGNFKVLVSMPKSLYFFLAVFVWHSVLLQPFFLLCFRVVTELLLQHNLLF